MAGGGNRDTALRQAIGHAAALFSCGRFDEAQAQFRALSQEAPERADVLSRLGQLALLGNRLNEAIDFLARSLHIESRSPSTWRLLAEAYHRKGALGSAAYCYEHLGRRSLAATLAAMADPPPYRLEGSAAAVELPWITAEPLPLLAAEINGRSANLVLDTGAGDLVLDEAFAIAAGVRLGEREQRHFAGGRAATVWYGHAHSLALDAIGLRDLPVQVLPLGPVFAPFFPTRAVHGILGTGVLSRFVATLDYRRHRLALAVPGSGSSAMGGEAAVGTPLWMAGDHYLVARGALPGTPDAMLFLDTGMAGTAFALPSSAAAAGGLESATRPAETGYGGGGEVSGRPVRLPELCLGGFCRHDLSGMVLSQFPLEHQFGFRIGGVVAHEFFARCVLTLDFPNMALRLSGPDQ